MWKFAFLAAVGLLSSAAIADILTLKCNIPEGRAGKPYDIWIVIDQVNNSMTVDGARQDLVMTNNRYTTVSKPVATFITTHSIDRESGEIVVTDAHKLDGVLRTTGQLKGSCERATPPPMKF